MNKKDHARLLELVDTYGNHYVEGMWGSIYPGSVKAEFHRLLKKALKEVAAELQLPKGSYEIRSNAGGIAVSGEVTLHGEHVYVQLSHGSFNEAAGFFRSCKGRKDYDGSRNHWIMWDELLDTKALADCIDFTLFPFRVIA